EQRILQVLANVLGNAIKFTPAGGRITVRLECNGKQATIAVADTGPGIAPSQLERIFERLAQTQPTADRSLGLGLFIARAIVEGHGGRIWAESALGEGSTFFVTLPLP
ncbi:MAG TPA: ATP-binding protein, partial [Polyangia bacterium]